MEKQEKRIFIPVAMKKRLEQVSVEKGLTEHAYIMSALDEKLRRDENGKE